MAKLSHRTGSKDIHVTARLTASAVANIDFIGKRLGLYRGSSLPKKVNVSAVIERALAELEKELREPTIKFDMDAEF